MSWVTDIILLCELLEVVPESGELQEQPPALVGINRWLESHGHDPLVNFTDHIGMNRDKAFQALGYGAAFNHLDVPAFLGVVSGEGWESPGGLLLLLKNEEEEAFTVYRMGPSGLIPLPS